MWGKRKGRQCGVSAKGRQCEVSVKGARVR